MDTPPTLMPESDLLDASGAIGHDTPCRRCGYNLRGLRAEGVCPECGTPVRNSISGDLLRFADPEWVEKLAKGIRFTLWGIVVAFVSGLAGALLARKFGQASGDIMALLGGALGLYGAWLFTEPDPSGLGEDQYGKSRRLVRTMLLIGLINHVLMLALQAGLLPVTLAFALGIFAMIAGVLGVVGEIAKLTYIQKLADRIPSSTYAQRARSLRWTYCGCMLLLLLGGVGMLLLALKAAGSIAAAGGAGGAGGVGGAIMGLGCFMAIIGLVMLVFTIMYIRLLYAMGKSLKVQAELARAAWVSAAPADGPASIG